MMIASMRSGGPRRLLAPDGPGGGGSASLVPSQDNTTMYSESGDLSNGVGEFMFAGRTGRSASRRGLVAFDVAGHLPAGSKIVSATLTLHVSQSLGPSQPGASESSP